MTREPSVAESIAAGIRSAIVSGQLAAGAPVTEKWASETYAASRLTVREVIGLLVAEGYLTREPYHSARVRTFSDKEVEDILDARELLEGHAATLSLNASPMAKARLSKALSDYVAALDSDDESLRSRTHRDLHICLVGMTDNDRLMRHQEQLMVDSSIIVAVIDSRRDDIAKMKRVHEQLAHAFLDGDQRLAGQLVHEHLRMVRTAAREELTARVTVAAP